MFRGKPEYNKKGKLNYKKDLIEFVLCKVFFIVSDMIPLQSLENNNTMCFS